MASDESGAAPYARIGAVMVTFDPPPGLPGRVAAALREAGRLVIVDNGSHGDARASVLALAADPRIACIANPDNRGVATALNQGLAQLRAEGHAFALLLDHDSEPRPGMIAALRAAAAPGVAVAVPAIDYAVAGARCRWPQSDGPRRLRFRFVHADTLRAPADVDLAIGSGMLLSLDAWHALGGFRDALFVDLVDTDFCLRARARGYRIVAVPQAHLAHSLGHAQARRLLGVRMYPTHHAPIRHYFLGRNRVALLRAYARTFPSWAAYELLGAAKLLVKVLLFEPDRWQKVGATVRGTWHGIRGRSGPAG